MGIKRNGIEENRIEENRIAGYGMTGNDTKKKNRIGIVHTLLIIFAAIGLGIVVLPQLIILLIALIISPDFIDVGRDVSVLSVDGSHGEADEITDRFVVSNGKDTFIYDDGYLCEYIDDNNIIKIKEIGTEKLRHMAINDKYLLYGTYDHTYRYDIESGEEISVLNNIYVEQIAAIDGTFFVETQYLKVGSEKKIYNKLLVLGEDATQFVEIPIDEPQKEYDEAHIEGIPVYETVYEDYCIYIGDVPGNTNDVLAVEKNGEMYAFRAEAIFMIKAHMVTMDDGRYMYNGTSYGIDEIEGEEVRNFACLSSKYKDDIYTVVRKGRGHNMEDANPSSVKDEYLVKISPETNTTKVLYEANNKTRILGFDVEANKVYLLNNKGLIYMQDLDTEEKADVVKLDGSVGNLYVEWCNDKLYVFEYNNGYKLVGSY
ncbi:MAG: hypothetical protein J6A59_18435 [Lachnospiraceae bacterium]|nr:hypothetical protein [Lachnospiraceae bacterium]